MKKGKGRHVGMALVLLFAAAAILLASCTTNEPPATGITAGPAANPPAGGPINSPVETFNVAISGFAFSPATLTVNSGDTVVWTNEDGVTHNVVSDAGGEIQSPNLPKGGTYSHIFSTPGTYAYICGLHPRMQGEIVVQ